MTLNAKWAKSKVKVDWQSWARKLGFYERILDLNTESRTTEEIDAEGRQFRPAVEPLGIPKNANQNDIAVAMLDRVIASSYDPNNIWHRYAFRWLSYWQWQKRASNKTSKRNSPVDYKFDYLQNEDGLRSISVHTNNSTAEASLPVPEKEPA